MIAGAVNKTRSPANNDAKMVPLSELLAENYRSGSRYPERIDKTVLRVYSFQFCPYAERVLLMLEAKLMTYEAINIDMNDKPYWYYEKCRTGRVPTIEFGADQVISESLVIAHYLEEVSSVPRLMSREPYERARQNMAITEWDQIADQLMKGVLLADRSLIRETINEIEARLSIRKTRFLDWDNRPSLVDYMIWPFVERVPAIADIFGIGSGEQFLRTECSALWGYMGAMASDEAVIKVRYGTERHREYFLYRATQSSQPVAQSNL